MKHLSLILDRGLAAGPERIAVKSGDGDFTYQAFAIVTDRLADGFRRAGVRRGDRIAVMAEKSPRTVAAAIAAWKCGAVYVPIDTENPSGRLKAILGKIRPALVCIPASMAATASAELRGYPMLELDDLRDLPRLPPETPMATAAFDASDIAYIIHTSGTTGEPKGVALSHASVISFFEDYLELVSMDESSSVINIGPFHFDVSFQDAFLPLFSGGRTYILGAAIIPSFLLKLIQAERVTHLLAVAPILTMITKNRGLFGYFDLSSLRVLITGAEVCGVETINAWFELMPHLRIINAYGPSEANSVSVAHVIREKDALRDSFYPIGKPLRRVRALLVDGEGAAIRESGRIGELLIGGPQLMDGYWDGHGADASGLVAIAGTRYYRTGDLCLIDSRGDYCFAGRADNEVKVAGRRINLLEIENGFHRLEGVKSAIAGTLDIGDRKVLVAVVEMDAVREEPPDAAWSSRLAEFLPTYMIPSHIGITGESLLNNKGKLDRKTLLARLADAVGARDARFYRMRQGAFIAIGAGQPVGADTIETTKGS